jgi:hypothetical protein
MRRKMTLASPKYHPSPAPHVAFAAVFAPQKDPLGEGAVAEAPGIKLPLGIIPGWAPTTHRSVPSRVTAPRPERRRVPGRCHPPKFRPRAASPANSAASPVSATLNAARANTVTYIDPSGPAMTV